MKRRSIAWLLLALAALAMALTGREWVYPTLVVLVAAAGVSGRRQWSMRPIRKAILFLLIGMLFSLKWRFAPYEGDEVSGFVMYSFIRAGAQFLLAAMTAMFFIRHEDGFPASFMLLGLMVLLCAGDVLLRPREELAYQVLALAYIATSVRFAMSARRPARTRHPSRMRGVLAFLVLGVVMMGSYTASQTLKKHEREASLWLAKFRLPQAPPSVGFSRQAKLESIKRIQNDAPGEIALRVRSGRAPGYLRGAAFDRFHASRWEPVEEFVTRRPARDDPNLPGGGNVFYLRYGQADERRVMDIWPSPAIEEGVFLPANATRLRLPVDQISVDRHRIVESADLPAGVNYHVKMAEGIQRERKLGTVFKGRCLQVPSNLAPAVWELAERIFADAETPREKMTAVVRYFRENYEYRLGIDVPMDADPLTYFLLHQPAAHCEYFASGAVILLRLGGVPARYVTGFVAEEESPFGDYWLARHRDAHAWVEAWDAEEMQWVLVEPTPPSGQPSPQPGGWWAYLWDYARFLWRRVQAAVSQQGISGLLGWVGHGLRQVGMRLLTTVPGWIAMALAALLVWRRTSRWLAARSADRPDDPLLRSLHELLQRMDRLVTRCSGGSLKRRPGETLHAFADRLRQRQPLAPLAEWYESYAAVRYSPERSERQLDLLRNQQNQWKRTAPRLRTSMKEAAKRKGDI
jgi:protein-glutamine gamma-glutamyltransferase